MVVAIDGPACSGKSTLARKVAKKLRFIHLNSGALFRAVALLGAREGLEKTDGAGLAGLARRTDFRFFLRSDDTTGFEVNGEELGDALYSRETGIASSEIAVHADLRSVLVDVQRRVAAESNGAILEGRDAGTVVFPDTPWKFYLDAPVEVRAQRRLADLLKSGEQSFAGATEAERLREIIADFTARDRRDRERDVAPLAVASDAMVIDTSQATMDEIVNRIAERVGSAVRK